MGIHTNATFNFSVEHIWIFKHPKGLSRSVLHQITPRLLVMMQHCAIIAPLKVVISETIYRAIRRK